METGIIDTLTERMNDAALARAAANAAARTLLHLRQRGWDENLGRDGDASANTEILRILHHARPDDAVLSEEAIGDPTRLAARRVWIVDPLDGTREYAQTGRIDWAVHVALWSHGQLTAGAVALPAIGVTLATDDPPVLPVAKPRRLRITVSRTRPPAFAPILAERLEAELVPLGSAGYKTAAVIRGDADAYVHAGGQYEWDSAAPVALAQSSALHASRLNGKPLVYNSPNLFVPDLLICRPELTASILTAIGDVWETKH